MRTKLIIENNGEFVKNIGIYSNQEALDGALAFFQSSLEEGQYFATIPLESLSEEQDKSALEMAEEEYDWTEREG